MTPSPPSQAAKLAAWFLRRTAPSGVRRVAPVNGAVASDVGSVREENQDRVALVRGSDRSGSTFVLAALADGIGGLKRGAECAAVTLGTFIDSVVSEAQISPEPRDWLVRGAHRANLDVHAKYAGQGGSTIVAVLLTKGRPHHWLSIGDSRVYQVENGKLQQLSRDDTLEGQLGKPIDGGHRADLLQFIGIGEPLEPHVQAVPRDAMGTLLLTTDGVHFVDSEYLGKVVHHAPDLGVCVRRLTELAKMLGGPDNASVAALSLDPLAFERDPLLEVAYDVWDPFGELQVMLDRISKRYPSTTAPQNPAPTPTKTQQGGNAKTQQKKAKGTKKKPKESPAQPEQEREPDVPQLLIEFPNKAP